MPFVLMDVLYAISTDGCSLCRSGSEGSTCYSISPIQQWPGLSASMAAADPNYMSTAASPYPIKRE